MRALVGWVLGNKSVSVLAALLMIAGGALGATRLNQELLPEVDLPVITVVTPVPGAGPEAIDGQVTEPIESAVSGVEGLEGTRGVSLQGVSTLQVELGYGADLDEAEAEIRSAVEGVALPEQAAEPELGRVSPDQFPVEVVSVSTDSEAGRDGDDEELEGYSDDDLLGLTGYVGDEVVPSLEDVEGVEGVDVVGGSERVVEVKLDPKRLRDSGVSAGAVLSALGGAEVDLPVGAARVEGDTITTPVRAQSGLADVEALEELPVLPSAPTAGTAPSASTGGPAGTGEASEGPTQAPPSGISSGSAPATPAGGGSPEPVELGDVADVNVVDSNAAGLSRTDGQASLTLNVNREPGANVVEVTDAVDRKLEGIEDDLGSEGQVGVVADDSELVNESVNDLVLKAVIGAAVAVLVISLFLRSWRAVLIAAVSLPTSVLAALLFSWGAGVTLNIITMGGLVVAIGRVVDDAIVVLENSYRYLHKGHDPDEATLRGTTEVASAITSSTLTTVAVFLPLAVVGGLVSQLFLPLALTVTFALLASLAVAVTIVPVLISLFLRRRDARGAHAGEGAGGGARGGDEREGALVRVYVPALRWGLRHRGGVLLLAAAVSAAGLYLVTLLPSSFFPKIESDTILAEVELPEGTTLQATSEELRDFEAFLEDEPGVEGYGVQIGGETGGIELGGSGSTLRPENRADVTVAVEDGASVPDVQRRIEDEAEDLYGEGNVAVRLRLPAGAGTEDIVEATIAGGTAAEREEAARLIAEEMADNPEVEDVESSLSGGAPQVSVLLDEGRAARAGLTPEAAAGSLATLFGAPARGGPGAGSDPGGSVATAGGLPVSAGVAERSLGSLDAVRGLPVSPGTTVADVAEVEQTDSPSQVGRVDGEAAVTVTGRITAEDITGVTGEVQTAVADLDLPGDTGVSYGGTIEQAQEGFSDLLVAMAIAVALVYLILVVFFGSALSPLVILLSLPLTTTGAFGAMALTGTVLSIPAMLGVLLLVGIVVANAILLVDFAKQAEGRGASADEAILEAGRARLRPVLMTASATVGALAPLALGFGSGSVLITSGLAVPVIGGLLTSTLLTLLVVPAGYSLARGATQRLGERLTRGRKKGTGDEPPRGVLPASRKRLVDRAGIAAGGDGRQKLREPGASEEVADPSGPASDGTNGGRDGNDQSFELGRALGRVEVLERELERRERELAEERQRRPGGLRSLLRRR